MTLEAKLNGSTLSCSREIQPKSASASRDTTIKTLNLVTDLQLGFSRSKIRNAVVRCKTILPSSHSEITSVTGLFLVLSMKTLVARSYVAKIDHRPSLKVYIRIYKHR
jgi:hypothetical protein